MKQRTIHFLVLVTFIFSQMTLAQTEKKAPVQEPVKKEVLKPEVSKKAETLDLDPEHVETQFLNSLDYPELQVVPRASERIQMDGATESNNGYMMFWPFLASSGTTMIVALMSKNKFKAGKEEDENFRRDADFKVNAAAGLSAAWFGLTYFVSASEPYNSALQKINSIKGRDKKSLLLRERLAEEAMQKPAELIRMLAYASTITNVVAAAGLMDVVSSDYNMYASVAILTAFLPLIFKNKYVENYEKQLEYKRKIYAPVVYTDMYKANSYASWSPRLVLQWNY
tara:strand:- start:70387 stop:71235 length:849 start_codon:yes stop_codon:yes gene_type:complete